MPTQVWSIQEKPVGQPIVVDGAVVGAVTAGKDLFVVGLDPASGDVLWREPASPGEVVTGIAVGPVRIGDKVAYFRPDGKGLYARLVVADPKTGKDVAVTPPLLFGSPPSACENKVDVCTLSRQAVRGAYRSHRLRVATGEYVPEDTGLPPRARLLGENGLVDFGQRDPELIGLVREGKLLWQTPLAQAFPEGFSSDNGWNWDWHSEQKVYVGTVYGPLPGAPDTVRTEDLAKTNAMAALSEENGAVLWRDVGSAINCMGTLAVRDSVPVRCRYTGTVTFQPGGTRSFQNLNVTVEGYDIVSGDTTWSFPAGEAVELVSYSQTRRIVAGPTQIVLGQEDGPLVLDLATGDHRRAEADEVFWCLRQHTFEYREPYYFGNRPDYVRVGGRLAFVCDGFGEPADGLPSGPATASVGADVAPYTVIATAQGFVGFRTS